MVVNDLDNLFDTHEKPYWETPEYTFYTNDDTRECTAEARKMDINGMELRGWFVLKAVRKKDDDTAYLICDDKGIPQNDTRDIWAMYDWIKFRKLAMLSVSR